MTAHLRVGSGSRAARDRSPARCGCPYPKRRSRHACGRELAPSRAGGRRFKLVDMNATKAQPGGAPATVVAIKARWSRWRRWLALVPVALGVAGSAAAAPAGAATIVGPRDSIQAAVDAAAPGGTILVFGRHRENVVVSTDPLSIRGMGAVVEPAVTPVANACFDPADPGESVKGICVSGDVDFETGEVSRYVKGVTVSGLTVRGFSGFGISAVAAQSATIKANTVQHNGDAGIAVIASTGTR